MKQALLFQCYECNKRFASFHAQRTHSLFTHGHLIQNCNIDIEKQRAEYYQKNKDKKAEYYQKNKNKRAEQQAEYYQKNKDKIAEQQAEYRQKNKDKIAEQQAEYRQKNKDRRLQIQRNLFT